MELISIAFSLEITLYHHPNKPFLIFEKEEHLKYIHVLKKAAKQFLFLSQRYSCPSLELGSSGSTCQKAFNRILNLAIL